MSNHVSLIVFVAMAFLLNACVAVNQKRGTDDEVAEVNVRLAIEYYRQGRLDIALKNLKKALNANADSVDANSLIALVYSRIENQSLAQEHYEAAVDHVSPDTVKYGQVHNNYGAFLCSDGQYIDAQQHFKLAAENKLYPSPEAAYENAGLCALDRPDIDSARIFFNKALAIRPDLPTSLLESAKIAFKLRQLSKAKSDLQRFHHAHSPMSDSLWLAYRLEHALGNKNKAQKLLGQLKRDFPDSTEAINANKVVIVN